jgi:hypothetical protein
MKRVFASGMHTNHLDMILFSSKSHVEVSEKEHIQRRRVLVKVLPEQPESGIPTYLVDDSTRCKDICIVFSTVISICCTC